MRNSSSTCRTLRSYLNNSNEVSPETSLKHFFIRLPIWHYTEKNGLAESRHFSDPNLISYGISN
jgi:hypothetical protein